MSAEKQSFQEVAEKSRNTWQKTSRNKNNKAEQEIKGKLNRSASNGRRRGRSGTPGYARDAPTEQFQKKNLSKSIHIKNFNIHTYE